MDKKLKTVMEISNRLLEICDNKDEFPRGDLQGAIEAQVMIAYSAGKIAGLDFGIEQLEKNKK